MKDYEVYSSLKVPKNSKVIIRLDGRSFHKLALDLNLVKPYDDNFYEVISKVCRDLFEEFSPLFVYTFSDEISLVLDKIPFDGRVEKIDSVVASFTASSFVIHYGAEFKSRLHSIQGLFRFQMRMSSNILSGGRMNAGGIASTHMAFLTSNLSIQIVKPTIK